MKFFETELRLDSVDTLVFAGGSNRCWWQAGAITPLPRRVGRAGVRRGAALAE